MQSSSRGYDGPVYTQMTAVSQYVFWNRNNRIKVTKKVINPDENRNFFRVRIFFALRARERRSRAHALRARALLVGGGHAFFSSRLGGGHIKISGGLGGVRKKKKRTPDLDHPPLVTKKRPVPKESGVNCAS